MYRVCHIIYPVCYMCYIICNSLALGAAVVRTPSAPAVCVPPPSTLPMPPKGAKNVLYLPVDDLRPQLAVYGQHEIVAPVPAITI